MYELAVRFVRLLVVWRMLTCRYTHKGREETAMGDQLFDDETYLADASASFDIVDTDGNISGLF